MSAPDTIVGVICQSAHSDVARYRPPIVSMCMTVRPPGDIAVLPITSYDVARNRNSAVEYARDHGAEWVWLLDDDQSHEDDPFLLLKLLARNVDIVYPLVLARHPPFLPIAFDHWAINDVQWKTLTNQKGLIHAASVGGGGLLIRRAVWETIPGPWFQSGQLNAGKMEEDTYFCLKAREHGFTVWLDCDVAVKHWLPAAVQPHRRADGIWTTRVWLGEFYVELTAAEKVGDEQYRVRPLAVDSAR